MVNGFGMDTSGVKFVNGFGYFKFVGSLASTIPDLGCFTL